MFEFIDRYKATGTPYPDPNTMCLGPCEGMGVYPHKRKGYGASKLEIDAPETEYEIQEWNKMHNAPDAHKNEPCDGWHFITCPDCKGTRLRADKGE